MLQRTALFSTSQRVIQLTALEDWSVSEKHQWDSAVKFMENTLQDESDKGIQQRKIHALLLSYVELFKVIVCFLCFWITVLC